MKTTILLALILATGCSGRFYAGAGIGKNDVFGKNHWIGRESTACSAEAGYLWRQSDFDIDFGWAHYSQCTRGRGFDARPESSLDTVNIKGRYYF